MPYYVGRALFSFYILALWYRIHTQTSFGMSTTRNEFGNKDCETDMSMGARLSLESSQVLLPDHFFLETLNLQC